MIQSSLPKSLWNYAVQHATYLMNRVPLAALAGKSPYQILHGELSDLDSLTVFGFLCYVSTQSHHRGKFDEKTKKCAFLGYKPSVKGFMAYDLTNKSILVSRDVTFSEHIFPCVPQDRIATEAQCKYIETYSNNAQIPIENSPTDAIPSNLSNTNTPNANDLESDFEYMNLDTEIDESHPTVRRSVRTKKAPAHLQDFICSSKTGCAYPLSCHVSYEHVSPSYKNYAMFVSLHIEPTSYKEAASHPCWIHAMQNELKALEDNNTWILVHTPTGVNPIGSKWVYKIKRKVDGAIKRHKAQLVAKGYTQTKGVDYFGVKRQISP